MGVSTENDQYVREAQTIIRQRLCHKCLPPKIHGYDKERGQLLELLHRTATLGESNSLLVIGPRGCGKTMLLQSVLEEIRSKKEATENLMEVHLNGLLQTDDRIALKEITLQLKLENTVGEKVFGSFAETLQFLLAALKSGSKASKSILFILDEFDLFAHHKNQTLLYNLLDVSQSAQTPICVVGLTTRLDVIELLEKRVKSRFSHRQLHLLPTLTFGDYMDVFETYISLPESTFCDTKFAKAWNKNVKSLKKEPAIVDVLQRQFCLDRNIRALQSILFVPVSRVKADRPHLDARHFVDSSRQHTTDSKAAMLHGVSVLELCLIIAMKHLMETFDDEPFNFEMVFSEYQKFCQRRSSMQMFEKPVVLKAFEHLCALELIRPVDGSSSKVQKEYRQMALLVDGSQVMEALQKYPGCPTEVKQWANISVI